MWRHSYLGDGIAMGRKKACFATGCIYTYVALRFLYSNTHIQYFILILIRFKLGVYFSVGILINSLRFFPI